MIGENIILKSAYIKLGNTVLEQLQHSLKNGFTITIGGESGCGKSTLATSLKTALETQGYAVQVLHMDDYFHRPPQDTHNRRLENLENVGTSEVNLALLQEHIQAYQAGAKTITKPLVHFQKNRITSEVMTFSEPSILLIEGTYVTHLKKIDVQIFLNKNYKDTYEARMDRGRDQGTDFVEKVLAIEHELIAPDAEKATLLIDKDYQITSVVKQSNWWKESIMYQIYPRSFQDSDGDGFGDLQGIISRLDYIADLGVNLIWLSPVYPTPDKDYGYDISDYYGIDERYGTMADFEELLEKVHQKGMKLIMDLVVNHSSDQHAFFQKSRASKDNEYRDYYIWRDNIDGNPPNNWLAFFGGPAWTLDPLTDSWYLQLFTPEQPDFNWENPKVREEVYKNMTYWLDKGVDGFRMDVISLISKRPGLPNCPSSSIMDMIDFYANGPKIHEYLQEMNEKVLRKYDIVTIGEGPGITTEVALDYIGENRKELNMVFQLDLMFGDHGRGGKFDINPMSIVKMKRILDGWDSATADGGWNNVFLDNHDFPRMVSRFGNDGKYREQSAKMLATMLLTMRGTPCIYQGSEIGMTNVAFDNPDDYKDVEAVNYFKNMREEGGSMETALKNMHIQGRDNVRTPMQWDDSVNGGFSTTPPWIKSNPNYSSINVEQAIKTEGGILDYYKKMIQFRTSNSEFTHGEYHSLTPNHPTLYCYERIWNEVSFIICLNFSSEQQTIPADLKLATFNGVFGNINAPNKDILQPWEGTIYCNK
ncbi:MAG: oligo-1,6-glucosidase [Paraglaciecola sp.]|jgi:oligo-1,6-glucosidase